jgi:putative mRNA 3-end processing factor
MTKTISSLKSNEPTANSIDYGNGIKVDVGSFSIVLDPKTASGCHYAFVSHAHIDHVHLPDKKSKVIASKETKDLAKLRGYDLGAFDDEISGIEMIDSGHILGSRAVLIKDKILYTGDLCVRDRAFLRGFKGVRCETLIIESTYGRRHYVFPDADAVINQVNKFISSCFDQCRPVVLTGYPLGKAQMISYLFGNWEPVYLHDSIFKMNDTHIKLGVDLKEFERFESAPRFQAKLGRGPWVLIAPSSGWGKSNLLREMKEKYNAVVATFTGWAIDLKFRSASNLDRAFPLSDHCDFKDLLEFVENCGPSKIYTMHGFSAEFAAHLRAQGFDAEALDVGAKLEPQTKLTNY